MEHVETAVTATFGWKGDGPRARIAPVVHARRIRGGARRVREVARAGGTHRVRDRDDRHRCSPCTARSRRWPSTTVPPCSSTRSRAWSARAVDACGGSTASRCSPTTRACSPTRAAPRRPRSCCSRCPAPRSWSADRSFAGVALAQGIEVVAFADLDAVALAVAAWRGWRRADRPPRRAPPAPGLLPVGGAGARGPRRRRRLRAGRAPGGRRRRRSAHRCAVGPLRRLGPSVGRRGWLHWCTRASLVDSGRTGLRS